MLMKTAKLFLNGRSQGVRLPREFRFEGDHVFIKKVGDGVLLLPAKRSWDALVNSLAHFSDDFMSERAQPRRQRRSKLFP
jgi:antitoxin VapB